MHFYSSGEMLTTFSYLSTSGYQFQASLSDAVLGVDQIKLVVLSSFLTAFNVSTMNFQTRRSKKLTHSLILINWRLSNLGPLGVFIFNL